MFLEMSWNMPRQCTTTEPPSSSVVVDRAADPVDHVSDRRGSHERTHVGG